MVPIIEKDSSTSYKEYGLTRFNHNKKATYFRVQFRVGGLGCRAEGLHVVGVFRV